MRAIAYALREGWASLRRTRGSSAFAVVAIALATMVLGALLLVTWNVEQFLTRWTSVAELSVFLRDDATSEQRSALEAFIDRSGAAEGRQYVSKVAALTTFRREFAELASLTDGFDDNPFPASIEVRLSAAAEADGRADALLRDAAALPGVADVRSDREWLTRIASGLAAVRGAGFALGFLMALAAAVTVAAVVRLGLHARRDEIEIMQLVGSPLAFIRGPFVAEGLMQGGWVRCSRSRSSGWDSASSRSGGARRPELCSVAAPWNFRPRACARIWWRAAWPWAGRGASRHRGMPCKQTRPGGRCADSNVP